MSEKGREESFGDDFMHSIKNAIGQDPFGSDRMMGSNSNSAQNSFDVGSSKLVISDGMLGMINDGEDADGMESMFGSSPPFNNSANNTLTSTPNAITPVKYKMGSNSSLQPHSGHWSSGSAFRGPSSSDALDIWKSEQQNSLMESMDGSTSSDLKKEPVDITASHLFGASSASGASDPKRKRDALSQGSDASSASSNNYPLLLPFPISPEVKQVSLLFLSAGPS